MRQQILMAAFASSPPQYVLPAFPVTGTAN